MNTTNKTHSFNADTSKVLQLMIHSLYTDKDIFLRELISNASDACDKLRYEASKDPSIDSSNLKIDISYSSKDKTITIKDNGIGMNKEELTNNLGIIAKSGTAEFVEKAKNNSDKDSQSSLIGQFGVGFYSAFMVSKKVTVISKKATSQADAYSWESDGISGFSVMKSNVDIGPGTMIILHLKDDMCEEYLNKFRLEHIIKTYSSHICVPIILIDEEGKSQEVSSGVALWTKDKTNISADEYKDFYKTVSFLPDTPFLTLHNKVEGALEYTNLLFIPSTKPFDLYHPDRSTKVKLYAKRVFVAQENLEIIPRYLRFLRGVIDSNDLPLNISRQTLQNDAVLTKIKNSVTKKVLSELKKKLAESREEYQKFYTNLGPVLREGLCEHAIDRDAILDLCLFPTSKNRTVTMSEYIESMPKGQNEIFYLTTQDINPEDIATNPQLEGFVKSGVEVLLLTETVDDFWVNVVHDYKGKDLKSVTRSGIDLSLIEAQEKTQEKSSEEQGGKTKASRNSFPDSPSSSPNNSKSTNKTKPDDNSPQNLAKENKSSLAAEHSLTEKEQIALIEAYEKALDGIVKGVKLTNNLVDSPACLAVDDGSMDIRMERFLIEQKQILQATPKVIEINPSNKVNIKIAQKFVSNSNQLNEEIKELAMLVFETTCVAQGEELKRSSSFAKRVQKLIEKALAEENSPNEPSGKTNRTSA